MEQQATDCLYGEKLQNRLAINRINLFTDTTQQDSQIRGSYLQSTGAGGKVFPNQLDSINPNAQADHMMIQQESSQPEIMGQTARFEQERKQQKLLELAQKHNERN